MVHLKHTFLAISVLFAVAILVLPAAAQVDRASLTGTVTDASGAVIVNAKVRVTHEGSGLEREGEVGAGGAYMIPQLPIGTYSVRIEAAGFRSVQFDGVQLLVGQTRTLDAKLEIATSATAIEVRDTVASLDRSSAELGTVVQSTQVSELPINGRNWASLMVLAAGAVNTGEGFQDAVRFVGRANDDNNWTFDGIDNTAIKDPTYGTSARLVVSMDSIAEFKVSSSLYSAESGGGTGGQVALVSKSGSNRFHGGLFEYLRNNALDARTIFDGPKLAPFRLNQFGGNIGGPIKTNKLFFFGNYEGLRQRQSSVYTYNVPSAALRNRVIAGAPALRSLIEAYPLGDRTTKDANVNELVQEWSRKGTEDSMMGRADYQISDRTTLFGRYNGNNARIADPGGMRPAYIDTELQHTKNLMVQLQHTFSSHVVNETRTGAHRVPRIEEDFGAFNETVNVPGLTALPNNGGQKEMGTTCSVINNLSVFRGRHNLKFGGEVRRSHVNVWWTASRSAAFATANDFVRNAVDSVSISGEMATRGGRRTYWFGYAQDEFKASRTLTLSLGARYEFYSVMQEVKDRILVFDAIKGDFAAKGTPAYLPDRDNIAPRASLAWAPDFLKQKTVIRAGYGMYYGPGQFDDVMASIESTQETFRLTSADVAGQDSRPHTPAHHARAPRHVLAKLGALRPANAAGELHLAGGLPRQQRPQDPVAHLHQPHQPGDRHAPVA
ncbi:MAG: TonB-dependent receptor [Acidobacteria bacterium]|nr:TonB-dependent receptor [Acidobacteriota bacterium]